MDVAFLEMGRPEEVRMGAAALRIYEELDDLEGVGKVTNTMGAAAYFRGEWDEALEYYGRAHAVGLRIGNHVQAAISAMNIGEIHVNRGDADAAEPLLREALRVFRASGYQDGAALCETYLGRMSLARRDLAEARRALEHARDHFAELGIAGGVLEATVYLAECHVLGGDAGAALRLLADAATDAGVLMAAIARVRALALLHAGRVRDAAIEIDAGLDAARRHGLRHDEELLCAVAREIESREPPLVIDLTEAAVATSAAPPLAV
jgi:tetratricopeptide (TPR) repeat protein